MRNTKVVLSAAIALAAARAPAQQAAQGFAVERLSPSAAGGGWLVMDELRMSAGLGGAASLTLGYAHRPLQLAALPVVSDQAFAEIALAATYDRFRLSLNLTSPLFVGGYSGAAGGYQFTAPRANVEQNPDSITDPRIGFDARIIGEADSPFRLGAGAQLIIPSGSRADYLTDDTLRAMIRVLFAGDLDRVTYAGQVGLHIRPLDDAPIPGSPRGSELLFGVAGGLKLPLGGGALVLGPELYGASALQSLFGADTTALEFLLGARFEGTRSDGAGIRLKLGAGGGLNPQFGAPAWRVVLGVELFGSLKSSN